MPVRTLALTAWNITDGVISEISGYADERRTLFTIQETVILPVVVCGFETWVCQP
jgi:hypothetical protein